MEHAGVTADIPAGTRWRKSTFSAENGCVEVGPSTSVVGVRDMKLGSVSPVLVFPQPAWSEFTGTLR